MNSSTGNSAIAHDRHDLAGWLKERAEGESRSHPGHSAHFDHFAPKTITVPPDHSYDYLGNVWPARFGLSGRPGTFKVDLPGITEEYFEILDVFESAMDATESYTMLEWGAGFGRWTSLGVAAARDCGIERIAVGLVEAHPLHLSYIHENLAIMGMTDANARVYPFALSGEAGTERFIIGMPAEYDVGGPWYGQALGSMSDLVLNGKTYEGLPELENDRGWRAIEVAVEKASKVLVDYPYVDLIDMDLQGAEADVVDECLDLLNTRVRRLHIGTHSHEIEERLRNILGGAGWIQIRDLPMHTETQTRWGLVHCVDGVQSWFNPAFPPPAFVEGGVAGA